MDVNSMWNNSRVTTSLWDGSTAAVDGDEYRRHVLDMVCVSVFFVLIIPVVSGNLLILTAIRTDRRLHTPTHVLIASLALADLVVGVVTLPTFTMVHHMNIGLDHSQDICLTSYILSHCPTAVSCMTLLIISVERFCAVHFPFHYQKCFTPRMMISLAVAVWMYVWLTLPLFMFTNNHWSEGNGTMCNFADVSSSMYRDFLLGHMIGVLVVTTILHSIVAYTAWQHRKRIAQQINIIRADVKIQRDAKISRMLFMVLGIFYICWVPYLLTLVPLHSDKRGKDPFWLHTWEQIAGIIVICNSFLNPVVYALQNKTFRRAFQKILCLKKYQRKPSYLYRTGKISVTYRKTNGNLNNQTLKPSTIERLIMKDGCHVNENLYGSNETLDDSETYGLKFLRNKNILSSEESLEKDNINKT